MDLRSDQVSLPIEPKDLDDLRDTFDKVAQEIKGNLLELYAERYEIEFDEKTDTDQMFGETFGVDSGDDDSISQHFNVYSGNKSGAYLRLFWAADNRNVLILTSAEHCKIEDKAMSIIIGGPTVLGAIAGFLSVRFPLMGLLLGALVGGISGMAIYFMMAQPIIHCFISKKERARSKRIAREILARVGKGIVEAEELKDLIKSE